MSSFISPYFFFGEGNRHASSGDLQINAADLLSRVPSRRYLLVRFPVIWLDDHFEGTVAGVGGDLEGFGDAVHAGTLPALKPHT